MGPGSRSRLAVPCVSKIRGCTASTPLATRILQISVGFCVFSLKIKSRIYKRKLVYFDFLNILSNEISDAKHLKQTNNYRTETKTHKQPQFECF